jgi:K+-sensing histidine kinase KdpD
MVNALRGGGMLSLCDVDVPVVKHIQLSPVALATINVGALCLVGLALQRSGLVHQFYIVPLVALTAINTVRYGRVAGIISTIFTTLFCNFFFQAPYDAFQPMRAAEFVAYVSSVVMVFTLPVAAPYVPRSRQPSYGVRLHCCTIVCTEDATPIQQIRDI